MKPGDLFSYALCLATLSAVPAAQAEKFFLLGIDGCDPNLLQQYMDAGDLPNFKRLIDKGSFEPLETTMPPQSPVAWSTVSTGLNPGAHGIFDFIHRHADSYFPYLSTSDTKAAEKEVELFGYHFPIPGYSKPAETLNLRQGRPFWEFLEDAGIRNTVFKMPANFPPVEYGAHRAISDMGTPDMLGTAGTFSFWTNGETEKPSDEISGSKVHKVTVTDNKFEGYIDGPPDPFLIEPTYTKSPFTARVDPMNSVMTLAIGEERVLLRQGDWSEWVKVPYDFSLPFQNEYGMVRFYLQEVEPELKLYASPVNFDPCNPTSPIGAPSGYSQEICEEIGRFYSQGFPEETKGLQGLILSNEEFLEQRKMVFDERLLQFDHILDEFLTMEEGMTFFYFGSVDLTAHMMWRTMDTEHPAWLEGDENTASAIHDTYVLADMAVGMLTGALGDDTPLMIISDHGFNPWHRNFHLNTWLKENGYLEVTNPNNYGEGEFLSEVNFWKTQAYAMGINSLYINERGREGKGTVNAGAAKKALMDELVEKLEAVIDPETGRRAIKKVYKRDEIYKGEYVGIAPDLIIGYNRGYRGSDKSAKGQVVNGPFCDDNKNKWSGDHCVAHDLVPGVVLSNRPIRKANPGLIDVAPTVLHMMGLEIPAAMEGESIL